MVAIGCDIEHIHRFKPVMGNKQFLSNIFTEREILYCFNRRNPEVHFAQKFACKEAVFKALSALNADMPLKYIEILNARDGRHAVRLRRGKKSSRYKIFISASCAKDVVMASSVAEKLRG